jgi:hypothetical protein
MNGTLLVICCCSAFGLKFDGIIGQGRHRWSDEIAQHLDSKWATLVPIACSLWRRFVELISVIHRLISVNGIMSSTVYLEQGGDSSEDALIARLRRFVEDSDLSFYQIASRAGTTGTILSMWLSGAAKPNTTDLLQIERLLKG